MHNPETGLDCVSAGATRKRQLFDYHCRTCGGRNIRADAFAAWNVETQQWEVSDTYDKGAWCEDCDDETRLRCTEITEADKARILASK